MNSLFSLAFSGPPGQPLSLTPVTGLWLALFLVLLNGFFVAAEFALVKVRPTQLEPHAGGRRGRIARNMVEHLDAYLSATQLGITLASLALGWVGEPAFAWVLEPLLSRLPSVTPSMVHSISLTSAFLAITILHIVLGELVPKSIAIRKPQPTSLWIAVPLFAFYKVTYPAIWILNHAANAILRPLGVNPPTESELAHSEEELRLLLSSTESTSLPEQKRELLDNVFELSHRTARQVMVPRGDVVYFSTEKSVEENLDLARKSGHTRFPLCEGELDRVIGFIHIKDLFRADHLPTSLEEVKREIAFVPETLSLDRLLRKMRGRRMHLAAVLDEYGGVSGIVTLENVIEEIVGQIQDEFDRERPEFIDLGDGTFQVAGSMLVHDLEDELNRELSDRDEDTIAGVVLSELGRHPLVGDHVHVGPLSIDVMEIEGNRIQLLRLTLAEPESESAAE